MIRRGRATRRRARRRRRSWGSAKSSEGAKEPAGETPLRVRSQPSGGDPLLASCSSFFMGSWLGISGPGAPPLGIEAKVPWLRRGAKEGQGAD